MYLSFNNGNVQIDNHEAINFIRVDSLKEPEKLLKIGTDILKASGLKWWLSFGTALGFARDGDFIPEDSDIDCSILVENQESIKLLKEEFLKHFRLLREVYDENGKHYQICFIDEEGFIFDLSLFYEYVDCLRSEIYSYHEQGGWKDDLKLFETLGEIETPYGKFPVPNDIETYLTARYGDWQTKSDSKSISS